MARRRLPPMPIEEIRDNPVLLAAPAAGYGMAMRLLHHFWETDCRPLPTQSEELRSIARSHGPTWRNHRDVIMPVVLAIAEDLVRWRTSRDAKIEALVKATYERQAAAKARRHLDRANSSDNRVSPLIGSESRQKYAAKRQVLTPEALEVNKAFAD